MNEELIDIYDGDMNLLGVADKKQVHTEGLWHKVFNCWIISEDGNIWLPLRSADSKVFPNTYDISCNKHVMVGETPKSCGIHELEDTYSIKVKEHQLVKMFTHKIIFDTPFKNREFCPTYLYKTQHKFSDLTIDNPEIEGIFAVDIQDLIDLFFEDTKSIVVDGISTDKKTIRKNITKADFFPYGDKYYQKVFTTIQRFIDNQ